MKKTSAKTVAANLPAVVLAEVQAPTEHREWAKRLTSAVKAAARQGNVMLTLVLEARDAGIPETFVRETIKAAYIASGSSAESARKRASDAVTVFKATTLPDDLPNNLQEAVAAVRKAAGGTQRVPRTPNSDGSGTEETSADPKRVRQLSPLQMIELGIRGLQAESNDMGVLSILAEMLDLAQDIAARTAKEIKAA